MPFFQPQVTPLPPGIDLSGQTAVVTGATSGIGLEISRQLLTLKVSTLILAVRNVAKGEKVKESFFSDPTIQSLKARPNIKIMELDTENYDSPRKFATAFRNEFQDLHIVMLNAGIATFDKEFARTGHEKVMQVNYLSNVLLTLELLPILEATSKRIGKPTRLTWTGSRTYAGTSLASQFPSKAGETLLKHFDNAKGLSSHGRYGDSKLLVILFQLELAKHYSSKHVIINNFCPGMIQTPMAAAFPIYVRIPVAALMKLRARAPEKAGWIALNAALVVGEESHGRLLGDKELEQLSGFVISEEGKRAQTMLWNETVDEMGELVAIPEWMAKIS